MIVTAIALDHQDDDHSPLRCRSCSRSCPRSELRRHDREPTAFWTTSSDGCTEGYPEGVPPKDYFPLLALLKRSLTEDEVVKAAQAVLKSTDSDTVTEDEIRTAVHAGDREGAQPGGDPSGRVAAGLRRLAAGGTGCALNGASAIAGAVQRLVSRRSGWVSGTWTKISVTPSGSVTCISCSPHGSCRASRAIGTPRPVSSFSVA